MMGKKISRKESSVVGVVNFTEQLNTLVSEIATHVHNDEIHKVLASQMDQVVKLAVKISSIAADFGKSDSVH